MATVRLFVDQQLLLTIFLVVLLWSLYARLRKHDFFRFWAWAWTSFAGYLAIGASVLQLAPRWTVLKGSLILASLVCGYLQVPLLVYGSCTLRGPVKCRRLWLSAGTALALAASALFFVAALYYRNNPYRSFALRLLPRALALAAALLFCARIFVGQWRRNRSLAALIAASFCSLYALDQGFYCLIYLNQLIWGPPQPSQLIPFKLLLSPLLFFLDLVSEFGICLGMVLLLVEEHQRSELALVSSDAHTQLLTESNIALETEITQRKRAEKALRTSEEHSRRLVQNSNVAMIVSRGLEQRVELINDKFTNLFGYTVEDVPDVAHWWPLAYPDETYREAVRSEWQSRVERAVRNVTEIEPMEATVRCKDGSTRHIEARLSCLGDTNLVTLIDVTARKRAEAALGEAQAELARVARIATMGELTASIAHEINQPLTAVVTNGSACLRWLAAEPPNVAEAREAAAETIREANRASEVIARIRALLNKHPPQLRPIDLNQIIREVLSLAANEVMRGNVAVQTDLASDLPPVLGDRVQLQQVILNLIMNGIDAMDTITDRPRELHIKSARKLGGVLVQIRDSGLGVDSDLVERIFEPFFTTKKQGIGMGLSISRSIIESHGGRLWAMPGLDHGTVFQFTVPIAETDERAA